MSQKNQSKDAADASAPEVTTGVPPTFEDMTNPLLYMQGYSSDAPTQAPLLFAGDFDPRMFAFRFLNAKEAEQQRRSRNPRRWMQVRQDGVIANVAHAEMFAADCWTDGLYTYGARDKASGEYEQTLHVRPMGAQAAEGRIIAQNSAEMLNPNQGKMAGALGGMTQFGPDGQPLSTPTAQRIGLAGQPAIGGQPTVTTAWGVPAAPAAGQP